MRKLISVMLILSLVISFFSVATMPASAHQNFTETIDFTGVELAVQTSGSLYHTTGFGTKIGSGCSASEGVCTAVASDGRYGTSLKAVWAHGVLAIRAMHEFFMPKQ